MRRHLALPFCILALASLSLGGCTGLKRALGMEKVVPDEFAVVSRAPLAIPPDYSLRPPRPGASPTQETSPTDQARQTIFRAGDQQADLPGSENRSPGENELLRQAGAGSVPSDIRQVIAQEAKKSSGPMGEDFVDKLLFWRGPSYVLGPTDNVIDPQAEAQRLKGSQPTTATATNTTSTTNATNATSTTPSGLTGAPVIERRKDPSVISTF